MLIGRIALRTLLRHTLQHFRVVDWRGDHITTAGPLAQIDQPAAVTTEGKKLTPGQHQCAARGAAQGASFLLGHTELDDTKLIGDPRHQIIVVRFRDLATVKFPRREFRAVAKIVDEQLAVNLRRVHLRPAFP